MSRGLPGNDTQPLLNRAHPKMDSDWQPRPTNFPLAILIVPLRASMTVLFYV